MLENLTLPFDDTEDRRLSALGLALGGASLSYTTLRSSFTSEYLDIAFMFGEICEVLVMRMLGSLSSSVLISSLFALEERLL